MIKTLAALVEGSLSILKGMAVTLKNFVSPPVTLQYPTQKQPMTERFRGFVDLRPEKCIVCMQCIRLCPTACLALTFTEEPNKKKKLQSFDYNAELCCFCGFCGQACPTQAIYMGKLYELTVYDRDKLKFNLMDPGKYVEWSGATIK